MYYEQTIIDQRLEVFFQWGIQNPLEHLRLGYFAQIINDIQPLTIFGKRSIVGARLSSKYASMFAKVFYVKFYFQLVLQALQKLVSLRKTLRSHLSVQNCGCFLIYTLYYHKLPKAKINIILFMQSITLYKI